MCYKRGVLPATEHSQQAPFSDVLGELVQGIVLYCKTPVHWSSPSVQSNGPVHRSRVQVLHLPVNHPASAKNVCIHVYLPDKGAAVVVRAVEVVST